MKPTPRKPKIIIAHVEGSGTAVTMAPTAPVLPLLPAASTAKATVIEVHYD
jgi:hypothetical protein